ncbi:MAG: porin [Hyphomicrobiaceae bacterium]
MTSRIALAAMASVIAAPAFAADLGGNCCADLEERIAELEATTARKGNRRVSLTVSGHVNEMMVFWSGDQANSLDDSGFLVATNNSSRSRFRFTGSANINAEWSAGFLIEVGVRGTNNSQSANFNAADLNEKPGLDVRHEALYIDSKRLGRVWLGHTGSATEGITEICIGCTSGQGPDTGPYLGGFQPLGAAGRNWQFLAVSDAGRTFAGEGDRRDIVMYVSPALAGFTLSAAAGSDRFYDVALRYAGEFNGIRLAAGVGYQKSNEQTTSSNKGFSGGCTAITVVNVTRVDCEAIGASASAMHVPTGLYLMGAMGRNTDNNSNVAPATGSTDTSWYVTAGVNRRFHVLGATNIYGEFGNSQREIGLLAGQQTEMTWWGVGINQTIDAAAMDIYLQFKHFEGQQTAGLNNGAPISDLDMVALGAIIRF